MAKFRKEVALKRENYAEANRLLDIRDMSRYSKKYMQEVQARPCEDKLLCSATFPDGTVMELHLCSNIYHYYVEPRVMYRGKGRMMAHPERISSYCLEPGMEWVVNVEDMSYTVCLTREGDDDGETVCAVMSLNSLANRCEYFYNNCMCDPKAPTVNNGYNCSHCDAVKYETIGLCLASDCPVAREASVQDCHMAGLDYEEGEYMVVDKLPKHLFNERRMWLLDDDRVSAVLFEYPADGALKIEDIRRVMSELWNVPEHEALQPIYLEGTYSCVFGFMFDDVAEAELDYQVDAESPFGKEVIRVLDDVELETENGIYSFWGVRTKIIRD